MATLTARITIDSAFVERWSERYLAQQTPAEAGLERRLFDEVGAAWSSRGYSGRDELLEVARWKSPRSRSRVRRNSEADVERVTRLAFEPQSTERLSILMALHGIGEPTASAILTVWRPDFYTVVDWRAKETLSGAGLIGSRTSAGLYLALCREITASIELPKVDVSALRALDRALWQFSKEGSG